MESSGLYAGTWPAIKYEICHVLDEIIHAIPWVRDMEWAGDFCQWAHRLD